MRWRVVLITLLALGYLPFGLAPTAAQADQGCSADWTLIGQSEGLDTAWFNVFGDSLDASVLPTITFDSAVIPYPLDDSNSVLPAVTTFTLPGDLLDPSGSFKMTFRAKDPSTTLIAVTIHGKAIRGSDCAASTTVNLDPDAPYTPEPTACFGDYTILTRGDGSAEAPFVPTIWFNVFDDIGFRSDSDVSLTFNVPVIPYPPLDDPGHILPAVTTSTMPPDSKAGFRTRDEGVKTVTVTMKTVSPGCETKMVVNLDPNAPQTPFPTLPNTATDSIAPPRDGSLPVLPAALILSFAGGLLISRRFLRRPV